MLCVHNMVFERIGRGSYGNVYRSSFQDGYVVKLMHDKELAQEEKSILEQVDKLDPNKIFHYSIINTPPEKYNLKLCLDCSERKKLRSCKHGPDCEYAIPIVYEDGGNSLDNYLEIRDVPGYRFKNVQNFYLGLWRIFYGVYVMSRNNCYHLDIKPSNIIIKETEIETIVKLIDYGLFQTEKTITDKISEGSLGWLFGGSYFYHPPESSLISESLGSVPMSYVYGRFMKGFEDSLKFGDCYRKLAPYFSTQKVDKCRFDIDRQTYTTDVGYRVTVNFKPLYTSIDIYMLGLSLKAIVANIKDYDLSDTDREFTIRLDDLTSKMCSMYVSERVKPHQAFESYLKMLKDIYDVDMTDLIEESESNENSFTFYS